MLYESGLNALCEKIIVVDAPEEVRIARTIARDYKGEATEENINKVRARIKAQGQHEGDLTIINDGLRPINELAEEIVKFTEK
jgi:dephospho-CoA kinase